MTLPFEQRPYRPGVGAVIVRHDGMVLVARRTDLAIEAWQLPQGGIKKSEMPEAAVLREAEEEIGTAKLSILATASRWLRYDLPRDLADAAWKGRWRGQEQMWFVLRFEGTDDDIDLDRSGHPEFNAWRWERFEAVPDLAPVFKQQLYADLVSEFSPIIAGLLGRTPAEG